MSIPPRLLDVLSRDVTLSGILNSAQVSALHRALDQAYANGFVDRQMELERDVEAQRDPMQGAIDRFKRLVTDVDWGTPRGWAHAEREMTLALNEAFRNGMKSQWGRQSSLPETVWVGIPGLDAPKVRETDAFPPLWLARKGGGSDGKGNEPYYRIEGDPNSVAVGRFKASLRKFLGVD